jgi:methylenetetrahydrofolate reductase (NADPH)
MTPAAESQLAALLQSPRYEVIPLEGSEDNVAANVPREIRLTITVSPTRGLEPSLDLASDLAALGYSVVPHLSARLIRDRAHLSEIVERLRAASVRDVLVVAGDASEPAGEFDGAAPLLLALADLAHPFEEIGITGYPEGHPFLSDEQLREALAAKAGHATYITSQIGFDAGATCRWVEDVWSSGPRLPIWLGLPGVVHATRLLRISTKIGLGDSARFLRKHGSIVGRLLLPRTFRPDRLLGGLDPCLADPERPIAGLHVFTFNELRETERWRRERLERLAPVLDEAEAETPPALIAPRAGEKADSS